MAKDKKAVAQQKKEVKPVKETMTAAEIFTPTRLIIIFLIIEVAIILLMKDAYYTEHHTAVARQAAKEGKLELAKKHYLKLLAEAPLSPTWNLEIGNTYFGLHDYDAAITHFTRALDNSQTPIKGVNTEIGLCYLAKGDKTRALEFFEREYNINPRDPYANFYLGEQAFKQGRYAQAAEYFQLVAHDNRFKDKLKEYWAEIEKKLLATPQAAASSEKKPTTPVQSK